MAVTRYRVPWGRFIGIDCRCDAQAPCLLHFDDLDWRGRNQALDRAGSSRHLGGEPVRVEVVEAITRSHFIKVSAAELAMIDRASQAEHQAAAVAVFHAREAKRLLEEMGILKIPTVLDMTRADVDRLGKRADAARRAMYELGESWPDRVPLGQVLKVTQRERARVAVRILREAGYREVDDLTVAE